jgi:hypothetical protein
MSYNKIAGIIFFFFCLFVIISAVQLNKLTQKQLEISQTARQAEEEKKIYKAPPKPTQAPAQRPASALTPSDPADYGLIVVPAQHTPQSLDAWEMHIATMFEDSHVFDSSQGQAMLEQIEYDPVKHQERMKSLDERIKKVEEAMNADPFNEDLADNLQMLYKVKAVGSVLERLKAQGANVPAIGTTLEAPTTP